MKKKKYIQKDIKIRQNVKKNEDLRLSLKAMHNSLFLNPKNRYLASIKMSMKKKTISPTRVRNRCVLTGRSRGIYKFLKISRIMVKDLASKGLLPGIKRASW